MQYANVISGRFLSRPNRFIAIVETTFGQQICHVKNTGRCRELLVPGTLVYLVKAENPNRKTAYDLIAVDKGGLLINMDAQAPNQVFSEWAASGYFLPDVVSLHSEVPFGASRIDFSLETSHGQHLVEVKGVTLEENRHARFPDAPTLRGVKHIQELMHAVDLGLSATLFFVVQMENMLDVAPNDSTHPAFGTALRQAAAMGVHVRAFDCSVQPDSISIFHEVPVIL